MIRETSIEAYNQIKANGLLSKRRFQIYDCLYFNGPMTAMEVFKKLGLRTNQSGRFTEMEKLEVIQDAGTKLDDETGMTVTLWDVTSGLPQKIKKPTKKQRKEYVMNLLVDLGRRIPEIYKPDLRRAYKQIKTL